MGKPIIDVCFSPYMLPLYEVKNKIVVVIDVLRATSTITTALHYGAKEVLPVSSVEECLTYKEKGFILGGERNGKKVKGFDLGNSPFEYMNGVTKDKSIALTTTNGTVAIELSKKDATHVVAGSFLNLDALCDWLKQENQDTLLLCAGWKNKFNMEDTLFAGAVVNQLDGQFNAQFDTAIASKKLYNCSHKDLIGTLKEASHYQRLSKLGIEKDIKYCLKTNELEIIPILKDKTLIKL